MHRRRIVLIGLAFLLLAAACDSDSAGPESAARSTFDLREALTDAGVTIVDDLTSAGVDGLQLWSWQVDNMERELDRGGGFLGAELDDFAGAPGGMPFSYLLAGWIGSGVSDTSDDAAALMGERDWGQAPAIAFPSAVLMMFIADAVHAAGGDASPQAMPSARLASFAQEDEDSVCQTVASWVNRALDFIFDGLKVETDGDGFLGWLGTVWNTALDYARGAVESLIEAVTAPVVELITDALAVVGVLTMISSLLTPWGLDVTPSQATTRVAVGDEPDIEESFVARADTNIDFEWPNEIRGCAKIAGLDLPDPSSAAGAPIEWGTVEFPALSTKEIPDIATVTSTDSVVGSDNTATLEWKTGRQDSDQGETRRGSFSATAVVTSDEAVKLRNLIVGLIKGKVPDGIPYASDIENYFERLIERILDKLVAFSQVRGDASSTVLYNFVDPFAEPDVSVLNPQTGCSGREGLQLTLVYPDGALDDQVEDSMEYLVRVDGVPFELAAETQVRVRVEVSELLVLWMSDPVPLVSGRQLDADSWMFEGTAPVGALQVSNLIEVLASVDVPDGDTVLGSAQFFAHYESDLETAERVAGEERTRCFDDALPTRLDFWYLERRFNLFVQVDVRGGSGNDPKLIERSVDLVSVDSDPTRDSTIRIDRGEPLVIDPIGLALYDDSVSESGLQSGSATGSASASIRFETVVSASRVRITGLYDASQAGTAGGDSETRTQAIAGSGALFTFGGDPMDITAVWNCDLEVGLTHLTMDSDGNWETEEVLIDRFGECAGRFEGTLEAGEVYQILTNAGRFKGRFAHDGIVTDASNDLIRGDAAEYTFSEMGDIRVDLTPAA